MRPDDVALLEAGAAGLGVRIGSEELARFSSFLDLLHEWNQRFRLTGERDSRRIISSHVVDSLAPSVWLPSAGNVVDVGSGGGFPGIVLGCLRPDLPLVLVEARRRPVSFLCEAIRSIPLPRARALLMRAEDAGRQPEVAAQASMVVSRAIRLPLYLKLAAPMLAPGGSIVAMQTPRTATVSAPELVGFREAERRLYRLPHGEERILLRYLPEPVP